MMPVRERKMESEWLCVRRLMWAESGLPGGRRWRTFRSERCLAVRTETKTPVQSAMALPKKAPEWEAGLERM
jgi:hypothetical protein